MFTKWLIASFCWGQSLISQADGGCPWIQLYQKVPDLWDDDKHRPAANKRMPLLFHWLSKREIPTLQLAGTEPPLGCEG